MEEQEDYKQYLDSDYPLLEKFREIAPGSFKHSQNVADMCELIAKELNLDGNLMKVAGLYHDVGKMLNPQMFTENQDKDNPHDKLDPTISYQVISRHLSDSVLILFNYNFPVEIIKIISQHHGNTIVKYFYDRSKSKIEDNYRYKCKQPETDEAAILMIVDSVEATARSLAGVNGKMEDPEKRHAVVDNTIMKLEEDGQLDNIKVGVLKVIRKVLYRELDSLYHRRVTYPEDEEKEE
jgi:putative nucleotidyltransferase with HDIG domain